jgi:hypothetical protein
MKRLFSYLFAFCALVTLALTIYKAIPVFPYINNDPEILIFGSMFLAFYYLAYRTSKTKKDSELI